MEDMAVCDPHDVLVLDGTLALGADLNHVWHCDNVGGSQHTLVSLHSPHFLSEEYFEEKA